MLVVSFAAEVLLRGIVQKSISHGSFFLYLLHLLQLEEK